MFGKDVLKRFTKDYNLPIKIYSEPYFSYLIELYDDYLNTKSKLNLLEKAVLNFENESQFLANYFKVVDAIIDNIKSKPAFEEFNNCKLDQYQVTSKYPKSDIYKQINTGKYFVSIDLVKANFQALKYFNAELVNDKSNYKEFLANYTDIEYFAESKHLRQVIFGNLNPKRQAKIERYLIELVINYLIENGIIHADEIKMVTTDELVFSISEEKINDWVDKVDTLTDVIKETLSIDVDIEVFKLESVLDSYYVKEFLNKEGYQLMCVPQLYFPQVYKAYHGLEIEDKDLVFYHEHKLAKFLEPIV